MNRPQSIMSKITTPMVGLHRSRVDDAAAGALAIHLARRGWSRMRGPNGSLLPLNELELVERSHRLDAGVADQNVDAPKSSDGCYTASICVSSVKSTAMPIALSTSPSSAAAAAAPAE
jgi:hypothetical protein